MNNRVFVTGGAGYCGSLLVPQLLKSGYKVTVFDRMFFGNDFLPKDDENLNLIEGDIRDNNLIESSCENHDYFVSLACISNDASFALDENLSVSINMDAFEPMVIAAKNAGIKRFIYASSSSVYGVSEEKNVTEDHPLIPLTLYNKYKGLCEPILLKHTSENFVGVIFRPATVCGYAPRLRLDLSVNILTNLALQKGEITVFGGSQLRPNLHVQDYCDAVEMFLKASDKSISNKIYNIGYQNLSIMGIAELVKKVVAEEFPDKKNIKITQSESDDLRSYHINSDKIMNELSFKPKFSVEDAIRDLCNAYKNNLYSNSLDDDIYYNVKRLKRLGVK
ncbi:SDR family oxidoreductase [bacterium]|nr:SDR family oxidoreductase [bacterium]